MTQAPATSDTPSQLPAPVDSSILGARLRDGGCEFALWAPRAERVELALVADDRTQRNVDMHRLGDDGVWSAFVEIGRAHV